MSLALFHDNTTLDLTLEGQRATLTRQILWKIGDIEQQVSGLSYSGENLPRDPAVEKAKLPPFALSFFKFLFFWGRLPNESELLEYYLQNFDKISEQLIKPKNHRITLATEGVRARLLRSYPSLIRDFHFFLLCQTSQYFETVRYSLAKDYFRGVDLTIRHQGIDFEVSVMLNSERARQYKTQKYTRHEQSPVNEVIMLFDLYKTANVRGKIKLFSMTEVGLLKKELDQKLPSVLS